MPSDLSTLPVVWPAKSAALVAYFNDIHRDGDFVVVPWAPVWEPLLPTVADSAAAVGFTCEGTPTASVTQTAEADYPGAAGESIAVAYNCEHWDRTPTSEQSDLISAVVALVSLASGQGKLVMLVPDNQFETTYVTGGMPTYIDIYRFPVGSTSTLTPLLRAGDIVVVEGQHKQVRSAATFGSWVGAVVNSLKAGNPDVLVYVQVSVDSGLAGATAASALAALQALTVDIDGIVIYCTETSLPALQDLLLLLRGSDAVHSRGGFMAGTGTITIKGSMTGLPTGLKKYDDRITTSNGVGQIIDPTLLTGDNTFDIPSGTTAILIKPPDGSTVPITVTLTLDPANPSLISIDPSMETLTLSVDSDTATPTELNFF